MTAPPVPLEDVASIEHLDSPWDIACEYQGGKDRPPCGAHAVWWLICRSCRHAVAECNEHRVEQHQDWVRWGGRVRCAPCGTAVLARQWRELFTVTPIEGRP